MNRAGYLSSGAHAAACVPAGVAVAYALGRRSVVLGPRRDERPAPGQTNRRAVDGKSLFGRGASQP